MALVDERIAENDCATAMACGVAAVVAVAVDKGCMLEIASVGGEFYLPCSDRVIVTKEVTGDRDKELEGTDVEVCFDVIIDEEIGVVVANVEVVERLIDELVTIDGAGGGGGGGGGGGAAAAGGEGAGGGGPGGPGGPGPGAGGGMIWF